MDITFYKMTDNENKINKNLENGFNATCSLKSECDLLNFSILLSQIKIDNFNYNYCYIPILKRYYFVTSLNVYRNGIIEVSLSIDVLMTYKDKLNGQFHIVRSSNTENIVSADVKNKTEKISTEYAVDFIDVDSKNILISQILGGR